MKKNFLIYGLIGLNLFGLGLFSDLAFAQSQIQTMVLQGQAKADIINDANKAINSLGQIRGRFIQNNPNNTSVSGNYWLNRPGKMRFEYDAPNKITMISNGTTVAIRDDRLKTTNAYSLRSTPLYFLLKPNLNLSKELNVTSVVKVDDRYVIAMRDKRNEAQGEIRIVFSNSMKLQEWAVVTAQKQITHVKLIEQMNDGAMAASLFSIPKNPNEMPKRKF